MRQAVAGFDLTFSVPKSVSVLWGVADAVTQERIVAAHHAAVADVIDFFEREVAATRAGISDRDGAVAQVECRRRRGRCLRPLRLARRRPAAPHARRRRQQGPHRRWTAAGAASTAARYSRREPACRRTTTRCSPTGSSRDLGIEWELRQRGARPEPAMGDRRRQRRPDHRVLQSHPRDRAQEGRAHRRVRRPPRPAAVSQDHRRAPSPGDAGDPPAEGGPIARRPDSRVASARRRAVGDRRRRRGLATLLGRTARCR